MVSAFALDAGIGSCDELSVLSILVIRFVPGRKLVLDWSRAMTPPKVLKVGIFDVSANCGDVNINLTSSG